MVRCTDEGVGERRGDSTATGLWLGVQMRGWGERRGDSTASGLWLGVQMRGVGGEGVTVLPLACG